MTKTYSIFELASTNADTYDLYEMADHAAQVLARAFVGAQEIGDTDMMDEIGTEMDEIDNWMASIDHCDRHGIDCENTARFMRVLSM